MSIAEIHALAIEINVVWDDVKYLKSHFAKERDFYNFVISAIDLAKAVEE